MKLVCRNRYVSKAFADNTSSADNDFDVIRFKVCRICREDNIDKFLWDVTHGATARTNKVVVIPDIWIEADDTSLVDFLKQAIVTQKVKGVVNRGAGCHREALIHMDTNVFRGWVMQGISNILNNRDALRCQLPALCSNRFTKVF